MDLLQRELARKKSVLAKAQQQGVDDSSSDNVSNNKKRKKKYMKQSEIRRLEEEEEEELQRQQQEQQQQQAVKRQKQEEESSTRSKDNEQPSDPPTTSSSNKTDLEAQQSSTAPKKAKKTKDDATTVTTTNAAAAASDDDTPPTTKTKATLSPIHVTRQLRAFGLPIRFFGETHAQRLERLEAALAQQHATLQGLSEMEEFRLGQGYGIRNTFLGRQNETKATTASTSTHNNNSKQQQHHHHHAPGDGQEQKNGQDQDPTSQDGGGPTARDENHNEDANDDDDNDPPKRVYKFLKGLLKQWEVDLEARPSSVANSVAGRNESKTLKQCRDYIRPLFKQLKRRNLEPGMQAHLVKIVEFAQQGEFVRAHDAYLDVAIGRAAWPIGVTMVGIHARSGRAKIESSNVAHVMNSELQRKYLTSVKRLLSYAQKKRPDVDPSKKVT